MKQWAWLILLVPAGLSAQMDTVLLGEAKVIEYRVESLPGFKKQQWSSDSLQRGAWQNLGESLREHSALFVRGHGGTGVATLSARGTNASHSRVYWNGLDLGSPGLGLVDLSTLPLAAADEVELQYGFAGLAEGSGALGASLQLRSKALRQPAWQAQLRAEGGSFGHRQMGAALGYKAERWESQTRIMLMRRDNDYPFPDISRAGRPYRRLQNARWAQESLLQSWRYRPAKNHRLQVHLWLNQVNRQLPPPLTGDPAQFDGLRDRSIRGIASWEHQNAAGLWLINSGLVLAENRFSAGGDSSSSHNRYSSWQNNLRWKKQFWNQQLKLSGGLALHRVMARSPAFAAPRSQDRLSAYLSAHWQWATRWSSSVLVRSERVAGQNAPLLGNLGLHWQVAPEHRLSATLGRNWRFPSLNDLYWQPGGNPQLEAETSLNYELAYQWEKEHWAGEVRGFFNSVDQWIQWLPQGNYWSPINLKKVHNYGAEWSLRYRRQWGLWRFSTQLQYSYTRSENAAVFTPEAGVVGASLPYVPQHSGSSGLALHYRQWGLRYSHNAYGRYYTSTAASTYMPAYSLAQLSLLWQGQGKHRPNWQASLNLRNLYDWPYQVLPFRPEPGFHFILQLQYNWHRR